MQGLLPPNTGGRKILPILRQAVEMKLGKILVRSVGFEPKYKGGKSG